MTTKPDYTCQIEYATFQGETPGEALQKLVDYLKDNTCLVHEENTVIEVVAPGYPSYDGLYRVSAMINAIHS